MNNYNDIANATSAAAITAAANSLVQSTSTSSSRAATACSTTGSATGSPPSGDDSRRDSTAGDASSSSVARRRKQNREAQRAYRERKANRIQVLEKSVDILQEMVTSWENKYNDLKVKYDQQTFELISANTELDRLKRNNNRNTTESKKPDLCTLLHSPAMALTSSSTPKLSRTSSNTSTTTESCTATALYRNIFKKENNSNKNGSLPSAAGTAAGISPEESNECLDKLKEFTPINDTYQRIRKHMSLNFKNSSERKNSNDLAAYCTPNTHNNDKGIRTNASTISPPRDSLSSAASNTTTVRSTDNYTSLLSMLEKISTHIKPASSRATANPRESTTTLAERDNDIDME